MDSIQSTDLGNGIKLHVISNNKFKTTTINFYIHNNLSNDAAMNAILPEVLKSGSNNFHTAAAISEYLEDMYGAVFATDIVKKGEIQSILFYLQFISEVYTHNDNLLIKAINLLRDIILNPIIIGDGFKSENVIIEKNNLKKLIESRVNDKVQYAVERCIETVCEGETFAVSRYGNINEIDGINGKNLYEHYKKIISKCPIDIFLVGDYKVQDVIQIVNEKFVIPERKTIKLNELYISGIVKKKKVVREYFDVSQGKLCLGYRAGISFSDYYYPALSLFTSILGGGIHSKLFKKVREKEALAYYIYSGLEKYKGLMVINSGIDPNKYNKVIGTIENQIIDIANGNITDQEIDASISSLESDFKIIEDNASLMIDYYLGGILYGKPMNPQDMVKLIKEVNEEQLIEVSKNIQLDTVFFLEPNSREE